MAKSNGTIVDGSPPDMMRFTEAGCRGTFNIEFNENEALYIDLAARLGHPVNAAFIKGLIWRHCASVCNSHMTWTKEQARKQRRTSHPVPNWMEDHLPDGPLKGVKLP